MIKLIFMQHIFILSDFLSENFVRYSFINFNVNQSHLPNLLTYLTVINIQKLKKLCKKKTTQK